MGCRLFQSIHIGLASFCFFEGRVRLTVWIRWGTRIEGKGKVEAKVESTTLLPFITYCTLEIEYILNFGIVEVGSGQVGFEHISAGKVGTRQIGFEQVDTG